VIFEDGATGTRINNGQVFEKNRMMLDHDIVMVIGQ
jgi:hypothetical protein